MKKAVNRTCITIVFLASILATSANATTRTRHFSNHSESSHQLVGIASFYGGWHAGRLTANGERFNPDALTCAHKTLPLGSNLRVTNTENGKEVVLRLTDRGPYIRGRIVDLSERAAKVLGFHERGLAHVSIEVISPDRLAMNR